MKSRQAMLDDLRCKLERITRRQADDSNDQYADHMDADEALLEFVDDTEIVKLFEQISKWYS